MNTLIDVAVADGNFKMLAKALTAAGLDDLPKDQTKLRAMLTYHVVSGKVMSTDLKAGNAKTVQGSEVMVTTMGGAMVNDAKVVVADVAADNGVIHAIDTVLMPK